MKHDQQYWQERYENNTTAWDLGHVSRPLKTIIDGIEDKKTSILIPGAGNAYEAIYLVEQGFTNVTVLDIVNTPLKRLKSRLKNKNVMRIIQQDFLKHAGNYDLILEQTFFCALESRFRESYLNKCHQLLNTCGYVQGVLFDFEAHRDEPPYPASAATYRNLFKENFEILTLEHCDHSEKSRQGKELVFKLRKK
jgi:thiopurine S-methyltransferase